VRESFLIIMLLAAPLQPRQHSYQESLTTYESLDGRTEFVVSGGYYYLGPVRHPDVPRFVEQYGEKVIGSEVSHGKCLSFGVFKFAVFSGNTEICGNVRIRKVYRGRQTNGHDYVGTCFELEANGCSVSTRRGNAALVYGYKVKSGRGVTEIYLSDKKSRDATNTLALKAGRGLLIEYSTYGS
jgi:hypothetical protein